MTRKQIPPTLPIPQGIGSGICRRIIAIVHEFTIGSRFGCRDRQLEFGALEGVGAMTHRAIGPESPFMDIIGLVAAEAIRRNLGCHGLRGMTGFAGQAAVCAGQIEIGCDVMVEAPKGPTIGGVACAAVRPKGALVAVVCHVATGAVQLGDLEALILVAAFTQGR